MGAAQYRYDKAGNRTQKTRTGADAVTAMEERYHYDSCNRLTSREIFSGDTSQPRQLQYQYDVQGSSILNRYEYDAFGDCTYREETVASRFGFAGEQYDPVAGMYYLRACFCNPVIGRFIQEDTYYGDGLNLYAYCHNNPVGYVDPSGHAGEICDDKATALSEIKKNGIGDDAEELYNNFRKQGLDPEAVKQKVIAFQIVNSKIIRS